MAREGSETAAQREGSLWRAKPVVAVLRQKKQKSCTTFVKGLENSRLRMRRAGALARALRPPRLGPGLTARLSTSVALAQAASVASLGAGRTEEGALGILLIAHRRDGRGP